jgi:hypothetical protein
MKTTLLFLIIAAATKVCIPASIRAEEKQGAGDKIPLPGLAISLGMSVDEVAFQLQHFEFRHIPEKRWQKNGHSFVSPELIVCSAVSLQELNEQLDGVRFVFEKHTLVRVELTIQNVHNAIQPLFDKLKLVETKPEFYIGLNGKILMHPERGNAESNTWVIEPIRKGDDQPRTACSPGQWVTSDDGDLAIRLSVKSPRIAAKENISLIAQIRNNRTDPVTILRPFGDLEAEGFYLKIWGKDGRIKYTGPEFDYDLDAKAFVTLAAGETVTDTLEVSNDYFAGIDQTGEYTLRFDYRYDGTWDKTVAREGVKDIWRGWMCSREVSLERD